MNVNFNGYGENTATFIAEDGVETGMPVKISANGTVAACGTGDVFCGICVSKRGDYAGVQLDGYAEVATTEQLELGYTKLSAGKDGSVAADTNGREYLVIESDASCAGIIL